MAKEKELRLALVCYGGVSLAVYMFGITREIHKLVRASRTLHAIRDPQVRRHAAFPDVDQNQPEEPDTERVYFELLQTLGAEIDVRVLVDIIAGASAGGINGIMLARAIAEDLPLAPLRTLWLENADVDRLLDPDAASTRWSKIYMRPLVWLWGRLQARNVDEVLGDGSTMEMRMKLSSFVRSRWFKPPFSGTGFAGMLFDALEALSAQAMPGQSLMPPSYPLDLFVTVTDYYGRNEQLRLHSPAEITEREHRLVIGFHSAMADESGHRSLGSLASLAFAARATASFPGAFPPARLSDIDTVLAKRGKIWPDRDRFLRRNLGELLASGSDPETAAFIDGSVLNNKPFGEAIAALRMRPAHREVDRRIVYIEPFPSRDRPNARTRAPGFFSALKASLSDIPRNQPIRDDLEWVQAFSLRVRRFKQVLAGMTGEVEAAVQAVIGSRLDVERLTVDMLVQWRDISHQAAAQKSGFAYGAYAELKVLSVLDDCAGLLSRLQTGVRTSTKGTSASLIEAVQTWALESGILPARRTDPETPVGEHLAWVRFLRSYDWAFRVRRLRFVIRRLNGFYGTGELVNRTELDQAKSILYRALGRIQTAVDPDHFPDFLAGQALAANSVGAVLDALQPVIHLTDSDDLVDEDVIEAIHALGDVAIRRALVLAYLGFPFYDVLALPMLRGDGLDEFDEIKVDRISAEDANAIRPGGARDVLKGVQMGMFGAFFSRAYRENDYLWGRLHAADRLVDIVLSTAEDSITLPQAKVIALKKRLFQAILKAEAPHLKSVAELMETLDAEVAALPG
jgi:patatin-related protein